MALTIDVRVNGRLVATAGVQNISSADEPESAQNYAGFADADAFAGLYDASHVAVHLKNHDRRTNVWNLVRKIAEAATADEVSK